MRRSRLLLTLLCAPCALSGCADEAPVIVETTPWAAVSTAFAVDGWPAALDTPPARRRA